MFSDDVSEPYQLRKSSILKLFAKGNIWQRHLLDINLINQVRVPFQATLFLLNTN